MRFRGIHGSDFKTNVLEGTVEDTVSPTRGSPVIFCLSKPLAFPDVLVYFRL